MSKHTLENILSAVRRRGKTSVLLYNDGGVIIRLNFLPKYILDSLLSKRVEEILSFLRSRSIVHNKRILSQKREYMQYKEVARNLVHKKLKYFNQYYGFSYNQVRIKNTKSRWGSCSHKKNLNFSYKLALLPEHLLDYVIVHELCHLKELNHSEAFWSLVEKMIPDYKKRRNELRNTH